MRQNWRDRTTKKKLPGAVEDFAVTLCLNMVIDEIVTIAEKSATLLEVNRMQKTCSYIVPMTVGLTKSPWKVNIANFNTGAGLNLFFGYEG